MRILVALLGLVAVTWLEFQVYPGHTYLAGETQTYLPMLERLDTPGFLSRDLVATNPTLSFTIYDEVALALHRLGNLPFEKALARQQLLFRFAAILGIYLLLRSAGVSTAMSVLLSGVVNAVTLLAAPAVFATNPEPVPSAFALGLVLLATGCLTDAKPLLSAFAAGLALLYDPVIGASYWLVVLAALFFDRSTRPLLRPTLPVLLVFVLLLANLSQLQVGVGGINNLTSQIPRDLEQLSRLRTPGLWASLWAAHQIWSYLFAFVLLLWATARVWPQLNRQTRWLILGLAGIGMLSVPLGMMLLDVFHLSFALQMPPQLTLVFVTIMAITIAGIAACHARFPEKAAWMVVALSLAIFPQILDPRLPVRPPDGGGTTTSVRQLATWAERETWGSSMFLFPDAGRALEPGMFRALSRRALWTDWQSGVLVNYSNQAGLEWWSRWQQTMQPPYTPARLESLLALPVDYYVLKPEHKLKSVRPVFQNQDFVAYDAQDLRNISPSNLSPH